MLFKLMAVHVQHQSVVRVALVDALTYMRSKGMINSNPLKHMIAAISVGVYKGQPISDLEYLEDSEAETDMNVILTETGKIIETKVQLKANLSHSTNLMSYLH